METREIPKETGETNQFIAVRFFLGFLPHMVSYVKFTLIVVGEECGSVISVLSFPGGSASHTQTLVIS